MHLNSNTFSFHALFMLENIALIQRIWDVSREILTFIAYGTNLSKADIYYERCSTNSFELSWL